MELTSQLVNQYKAILKQTASITIPGVALCSIQRQYIIDKKYKLSLIGWRMAIYTLNVSLNT